MTNKTVQENTQNTQTKYNSKYRKPNYAALVASYDNRPAKRAALILQRSGDTHRAGNCAR